MGKLNVLISVCANNLDVIASLNSGHTHYNIKFFNVDLIGSIKKHKVAEGSPGYNPIRSIKATFSSLCFLG